MTPFTALSACTRYEMVMQLRRPSLYVGFILLVPLLIAYLMAQFDFLHEHVPGGAYHFIDVLDGWGSSLFGILPVAIGLMLADRFARDRRLKVDELMQTYSNVRGARVIGKWLGGTLALLVPSFLVYSIGVAAICMHTHEYNAIPTAFMLWIVGGIPIILFVAAFSIVCPIIMPVPLYQFLFIGYWGWAVSLHPGGPIPTIRGTVLSPDGAYIGLGLFPSWWNTFSVHTYGHVTPVQGIAQIAILLGLAISAIVLGIWLLRIQENRQ